VACFFNRPWDQPSLKLSAPDRAWLLNQAAFYLRALGRPAEALGPMRAGLAMAIEQEAWRNAAISASNLSELELNLGELSAATADTEQSVGFADRSKDASQRMSKRTAHADALHQAGRMDQARRLFVEAEALQAEQQPYTRLYSLRGFQYCDRLLSDPEGAAWRRILDPAARIPDLATLQRACDRTTERATEALRIAEQNELALLTIALDRLTLGRAALYQAILATSRGPNGTAAPTSSAIRIPSTAIDYLTAAVDGLRESGSLNHLPRGLLTRAWQRRLVGDTTGAATDLDQAWDIAERGPMPLYQTDIRLTRARLFGRNGADYPWGSPREDLAEARRLIEKHGYHRRDRELADAEAALG